MDVLVAERACSTLLEEKACDRCVVQTFCKLCACCRRVHAVRCLTRHTTALLSNRASHQTFAPNSHDEGLSVWHNVHRATRLLVFAKFWCFNFSKTSAPTPFVLMQECGDRARLGARHACDTFITILIRAARNRWNRCGCPWHTPPPGAAPQHPILRSKSWQNVLPVEFVVLSPRPSPFWPSPFSSWNSVLVRLKFVTWRSASWPPRCLLGKTVFY